MEGTPWYLYIAAAIPAVLLTILLFMDQQITSVIVNRKEHQLKVSKKGLHHLLGGWTGLGSSLLHFDSQEKI